MSRLLVIKIKLTPYPLKGINLNTDYLYYLLNEFSLSYWLLINDKLSKHH